MRTSSPGCATRTWRMMRVDPRPLWNQMGPFNPTFQPNMHLHLSIVIWHYQQEYPVLLQCLLQLDSTPFDAEELPVLASFLVIASIYSECLQDHLLQARLPVVGPRSVPCNHHLLCHQGPLGLPVLLPALLCEMSHWSEGWVWAPARIQCWL
uniref:Uncharacterized protein n=1 Tax=Equus asinus asinus TaxID=83772 RepID=A0A8C4LNY6_EQUAS